MLEAVCLHHAGSASSCASAVEQRVEEPNWHNNDTASPWNDPRCSFQISPSLSRVPTARIASTCARVTQNESSPLQLTLTAQGIVCCRKPEAKAVEDPGESLVLGAEIEAAPQTPHGTSKLLGDSQTKIPSQSLPTSSLQPVQLASTALAPRSDLTRRPQRHFSTSRLFATRLPVAWESDVSTLPACHPV